MSLFFLGVGNLHRGDDGVGPFLAEKLASDKRLAALGVQVLDHSGEGASLIELFEGASKVVVVDAMSSGQAHGVVQKFDVVKESLSSGVFRYSSHLFGLAEAVEMARPLGKLPKEMIVFGIEGRVYNFGASLSAPVAAAAKDVEKAVLDAFGVKG